MMWQFMIGHICDIFHLFLPNLINLVTHSNLKGLNPNAKTNDCLVLLSLVWKEQKNRELKLSMLFNKDFRENNLTFKYNFSKFFFFAKRKLLSNNHKHTNSTTTKKASHYSPTRNGLWKHFLSFRWRKGRRRS